MSIRDLMPIRRNRVDALPDRRRRFRNETSPFLTLHREMDRLFEELMADFFPAPRRRWFGRGTGIDEEPFLPAVDVREKARSVVVTAELPGVDEKDIEVRLDGDTLIIRGEKHEEKEDAENGWFRSERSYGAFVRSVPLPAEVDPERAEASFRRGVLKVTLPKLKTARDDGRRIEVKTA
ncbi:MAG: Hsp20/alpha crystallin family protein [Kiritimatiellaeota bacterium]|nr:Hsp20/alpha crystallin family protein [Kiritimatiellota bacterium]